MQARLGEQSNKEYVGGEVKRAVKSHFKVYLEEINQMKKGSARLEGHIDKTGKGL